MADSVFTKIINGELPAAKIYEDDKNLAFLTIQPIQPGHTLVVPKTQVDHLWDLSDEDYQSLMAAVKKVAAHLLKTAGKKRIGVKVEGFEVPHAHVHLIPVDNIQEYNSMPVNSSPKELAQMAAKLAF